MEGFFLGYLIGQSSDGSIAEGVVQTTNSIFSFIDSFPAWAKILILILLIIVSIKMVKEDIEREKRLIP